MNAEEKRERLLKRVLPALGITIIYFVFISGILSEKMTSIEEKYKSLVSSGVSKNSTASVMRRQSELQQQIRKLEAENKVYTDKLKELAGFLSSDNSSNAAATAIAEILAKNNIMIQREEREAIDETKLSVALKEIWQRLSPAEKQPKKTPEKSKENAIYVQHLWLKGNYQQLFSAMNTIANSDIQALPISFTMRTPETDNALEGELEWELILWM